MGVTHSVAGEDGLAVCSWSLLPESPEDLAKKVRSCGLRAVQMDLRAVAEGGAWEAGRVRDALGSAGVGFVSGMIGFEGEDYTTLETIRRTGGVRPDAAWGANLARVRAAARAARELGIRLVTMHAGFMGGDRRDPGRAVMLERLREAARALAGEGAALALETGQERAGELREALEELAAQGVGVNFDPANVILYGAGDPVEAFGALAGWVKQMHLKDALPAPAGSRGEWGTEVPIGRGAVDWDALLQAAAEHAPVARMVIEREGGDRRAEDVREGAAFVRDALARTRGGMRAKPGARP